MPFFTRPNFEDRQQVQYQGTSITLSGNTNIYPTGQLIILSPILDFTGTTTASTLYNIAGLSGYINSGNISALKVQPPTLYISGSTGVTTVDVTGYYLGSIDSGGTISWISPVSTFTGNTSATCISDIFVSNIHSCSPLYINPNDEGNIFFGSTSAVTIDLQNNRLGIGTSTPSYPLHVVGYSLIQGDLDIIGNVNIIGSATTINTEVIQSKDNKILLNYSGNSLSAIGGGISVYSANINGDTELVTDNNGNWVSNVDFIVSGKTKTTTLQITSGATAGYVLTAIDSSGNTEWSPSVIDVTYDEFYSKITSEQLETGKQYRLTNYRSVNFLNGWENASNPYITPSVSGYNPTEIYTGETEILLLEAISNNSISKTVYSENYPQDIIEYDPYVNKMAIGMPSNIYNGSILPNFSAVTGFDLQWDGTNVYFNMPTGYPVLFGYFLDINYSILSSNYSGVFNPTKPNVICEPQYWYYTDPSVSRIKIDSTGYKVTLIDLTYDDYTGYTSNNINAYTVYSIGDAYGWITRRNDRERNINVPLDFRGRKYRRFEIEPFGWITTISYLATGNTATNGVYNNVNISLPIVGTTPKFNITVSSGSVTSVIIDFSGRFYKIGDVVTVLGSSIGGTNGVDDVVITASTVLSNKGYWAIGDDFNGQISTGNYVDYKCIGANKGDIYNIEWFDIGVPHQGTNYFIAGNDNVVFKGDVYNVKIGGYFRNNTIGDYFHDNVIGNDCYGNIIGNLFVNNEIGNEFQNNIIYGGFTNNNIKNQFYYNQINYNFTYNKIDTYFTYNIINYSSGLGFERNKIGYYFFNNRIGYQFTDNIINNYFQSNIIKNVFIDNVITNNFQANTIKDYFTNNKIGSYFGYNNIKNYFRYSEIGATFTSNNIDDNFLWNFIGQQFSNNIVGNGFKLNKINGGGITLTDFSTATFVYGNYDCEIFRNNSGNPRLSYYDSSDILTITGITS